MFNKFSLTVTAISMFPVSFIAQTDTGSNAYKFSIDPGWNRITKYFIKIRIATTETSKAIKYVNSFVWEIIFVATDLLIFLEFESGYVFCRNFYSAYNNKDILSLDLWNENHLIVAEPFFLYSC